MLWSVVSLQPWVIDAELNDLCRVLDAVNLALTIHAMYYYLVIHFGGVDALIHVVWYVRPTLRVFGLD